LIRIYFLISNSKTYYKKDQLKEMIKKIESTRQRVIKKKEFIAYTINNEEKEVDKEDYAKEKKETSDKKEIKKTDDKEDKKDKKEDEDKKDKKDKDKKDDKKIKATITTDDEVVKQEIVDKLVDKNIIKDKDKQEFLDYLDDNDYSPYIQIGKFKVDSEMSMKELAETFTTYPGN